MKHREFAQASGEKTAAQFAKFLEDALGLLAEHSVDGSIHFVCSDWRHLDEMLTAGHRVYRELKTLAVWNKTNAGMGSFYRSQHELIFVWKHGRGKHKHPKRDNFRTGGVLVVGGRSAKSENSYAASIRARKWRSISRKVQVPKA